jgi:hypothetical protein
VQFHLRAGGGGLLQEAEELLVPVPRIAGVRGDLAGRDLEGGEQGGRAVALADRVVRRARYGPTTS